MALVTDERDEARAGMLAVRSSSKPSGRQMVDQQEFGSSGGLVPITPVIGFLPESGVIVNLGRLNIESGDQSISVYTPAEDMQRFNPSGERASADRALFDHLSGMRNLVAEFHLRQGTTEKALVLSMNGQIFALIADNIAQSLRFSLADAKRLLDEILSGIPNFPEIIGRARSLNKIRVIVEVAATDRVVDPAARQRRVLADRGVQQ